MTAGEGGRERRRVAKGGGDQPRIGNDGRDGRRRGVEEAERDLAALDGAAERDRRRGVEEAERDRRRGVEEAERALAALDGDDMRAALRRARTAVASARRAGDSRIEGRARLVLARALAHAGRVAQASVEIERAEALVGPDDRGRLELHRMTVLYKTGDHAGALAALEQALRLLPDDSLDKARALNNRGVLRMYIGGFADGLADLREARRRYRAQGAAFGAAETLTNIGMMLDRLGDVPAALRAFGRAEAELRALGAPVHRDIVAQAEVQLRAGLYEDVLARLPAAVAALGASGMASDAAEGALYLAQAQLMADHPDAALSAARARAALARARRWGWAALARHAQTQARVQQGAWGRRGLRDALAATELLRRAGLIVEERESWLLAGRIAAASDLDAEAARCFGQATRRPERGASFHAVVIRCEASARLAQLQGRPRVALRWCGRGLARVEEHLAGLIATDLRAAAARRGATLARLGLDIAWAEGGPAELLRWAERWRAVALHAAPEAPTDPQLVRLLAELRTASAELRERVLDGHDADEAQRRCQELEAAVNRASRERRAVPRSPIAPGPGPGPGRPSDAARSSAAARPSGAAPPMHAARPSGAAPPMHAARPSGPARPTLAQLRGALTGRALVEIVERDGQLGAIVVDERRARLVPLGAAAPIAECCGGLQFALRRMARLSGVAAEASLRSARRLLDRLDELVTVPLAAAVRVGVDLVVVPDGATHDVPWGAVLGRLGPVTVAPSAALWLRSVERPSRAGGSVLLVAGPRLDAAAEEVAEVAALYSPRPTVLTGRAATVAAVGRAAEGAAIAHLAAHGTVRRDNPLFSSLELSDGPATVLDLEHLRRPPSVIVLAACNSAVGAVSANNDVVGLAAAMLSGGATTVVASTMLLPDRATVPAMVRLHAALARGAQPSHALAEVRAAAAAGDPAAFLTATALVCLGAG